MKNVGFAASISNLIFKVRISTCRKVGLRPLNQHCVSVAHQDPPSERSKRIKHSFHRRSGGGRGLSHVSPESQFGYHCWPAVPSEPGFSTATSVMLTCAHDFNDFKEKEQQ
jgi:hypothetical protein